MSSSESTQIGKKPREIRGEQKVVHAMEEIEEDNFIRRENEVEEFEEEDFNRKDKHTSNNLFKKTGKYSAQIESNL